MRTIAHSTTSESLATSGGAVAVAGGQRTPWHSPVPYLFGGLAAMLGLIAFALLILACSYWRLSSRSENRDDREDLESGNGGEKEGGSGKAPPKVYEEKILVIMAGNDTPTFLATPVCAKISTFCDANGEEKEKKEEEESCGKVKKEVVMVISSRGQEQEEEASPEENTVMEQSTQEEEEEEEAERRNH